MKYDFCFVISDMLSTTPRAYRAIKTLVENNYSVYLVFNERIETAKSTNKLLLDELTNSNFNYKRIVWKKKSFKTIFFKIIHKLFKMISRFVKLKNPYLLALSNDFPTILQIHHTKKIKAKIYAGHRPAVLPALVLAAKKHAAKTWFDIEDYHCEESTDSEINRLMQHFTAQLPATYYTNASALIGEAYLKKNKFDSTSLELLNSPIDFEYIDSNNTTDVIRFFWFSQYVSFKRGLELFLNAVKKVPFQCELHLAGNIYDEFRTYIEALNISNLNIIYYNFIPENKINELAQNCDFGLALEQTTTHVSVDLAIANKLLSYAVAGCYIVATDTKGQIDFMKRLPDNGTVIEQSAASMQSFLETIPQNISSIRAQKNKRIANAKSVSWEVQKEQLVGFATRILNA